MSRGQPSQNQLGQVVEHAYTERTALNEMTGKFKEVVQAIGLIGARLSMMDMNDSENSLSSESILDIVQQVKALKLSVVCNAKFGKIY